MCASPFCAPVSRVNTACFPLTAAAGTTHAQQTAPLDSSPHALERRAVAARGTQTTVREGPPPPLPFPSTTERAVVWVCGSAQPRTEGRQSGPWAAREKGGERLQPAVHSRCARGGNCAPHPPSAPGACAVPRQHGERAVCSALSGEAWEVGHLAPPPVRFCRGSRKCSSPLLVPRRPLCRLPHLPRRRERRDLPRRVRLQDVQRADRGRLVLVRAVLADAGRKGGLRAAAGLRRPRTAL
jgi:hypothetical protein